MNQRLRTAFQPVATLASVALAIFLFAATSTTASATSMRLVNYVSYSYAGNSAELGTDGVENLDIGSPTYQLRLELWAFPAPYTSGMNGIRLAAFPMLALQPGELTGKIDSGPIAFTLPPNGVWYFSMLLTEFSGSLPQNDGYVVRDWINFQTPEYIGVPPPPKKVTAVEFYHQGLDHYFIAASEDDIMTLDTGAIQGWTRTGDSFNVWDGPLANTVPVCRFYIPPGFGDSHFFSASPEECAIAPVWFPYFFKESDAAFYIALPDTTTGACQFDEYPVYRLWNTRQDSNHRYTTSLATKAAMIAKGYIPEGYGPDKVAMCWPQ